MKLHEAIDKLVNNLLEMSTWAAWDYMANLANDGSLDNEDEKFFDFIVLVSNGGVNQYFASCDKADYGAVIRCISNYRGPLWDWLVGGMFKPGRRETWSALEDWLRTSEGQEAYNEVFHQIIEKTEPEALTQQLHIA